MTDRAKPKSCSSQTGARVAGAEIGGGARQRLTKRVAAAKVRVGHDYMDTLSAARRRKHPDKQTRLMNELRAMLLDMKAALGVAARLEAKSAPPWKVPSRAKRGVQAR